MSNIHTLEERIEEAQALLAGTAPRDDFASRMSRRSMEAHVSDLQEQLHCAKKEREEELAKRSPDDAGS